MTRGGGTVTIDPDGSATTANTIVFDEPNFNSRFLRGNAVLRWEYRPGSTLFLVWQQQREDDAAVGDFNLHRDFTALFGAKAQNILAVKATFWLAR